MAKSHKPFGGQVGVSFPGAGQLKEVAAQVSTKGRNGKKRKPDGGQSKAKLGFKMNKSLGQHLLKNPGIVAKILAAGEIKRSDVVLEIGPGTGNLTVQLCGIARRVIALEIDPRMASEVKKRCLMKGYTNFEIKEGDALKSDLGDFHVCTANLPYQISSPFVFRLVSHPHPFRCAVLMFQKEFGERLVAQPGDKLYSRLGVNTQVFCKVSRVCHVAAASFNPPPKVDSIVVKLCPSKEYEIVRAAPCICCGHSSQADYAQWDGMLRILFSRKNRTIGAAFKLKSRAKELLKIHEAYRMLRGLQPDTRPEREQIAALKAKIAAELDTLGFSQRRAINMSIVEFQQLQLGLHSIGVYFSQQKSASLSPTLFEPEDMERDDEEEELNSDGDEMAD